MKRLSVCIIVLAAVLWLGAGLARAQQDTLRVAVFDFETKGEGMASDTGRKIADLLTVFLSMQENLQLVERGEIKKILEELELSKTGLVDTAAATRVGALLGAQVLVTGRAFVVKDEVYVTGKAISVETGRVSAQLAKGTMTAKLDEIVQDLATKLGDYLKKNSALMVAKVETPQAQVDILRKALGKMELPTTSVCITEWHIGQLAHDPAAQTEMTYLLRKVGAEVVDAEKLQLADWAKEFLKETNTPIPEKAATDVDMIIVGEGFSEYAGRQGNLLSVKARVEVKAVDTKTRKILAICAKTVTSVELAEHIAGKTALQRAAGEAAVEMLPEAVAAWEKAHAGEKKEPKKEDKAGKK